MVKEAGERPVLRGLLEAKRKFGPLVKDKVNPFYKSKYADLAALINLVEDPLLEQGIIISQPTMRWEASGIQYIKTRLLHVSGDEEFSTLDIPQGLDPQKTVAAITYLKRAALQAILGIPAEDDDGNAAAGHPVAPAASESPKIIPGFGKQPKPKTELKPDATVPNAGLASVTVKSIGTVKISGVEAPILHTSGGDFIVDPRKPTSKDIMQMAQKATVSGDLVVLDFVTSEKTGNNLVTTIRMEA
jgi:hypothetical protein